MEVALALRAGMLHPRTRLSYNGVTKRVDWLSGRSNIREARDWQFEQPPAVSMTPLSYLAAAAPLAQTCTYTALHWTAAL